MRSAAACALNASHERTHPLESRTMAASNGTRHCFCTTTCAESAVYEGLSTLVVSMSARNGEGLDVRNRPQPVPRAIRATNPTLESREERDCAQRVMATLPS